MITLNRRKFVKGSIAIATVPLISWAEDSEYPTHPIEIVVPSSAGGGTDIVTRIFAETCKKYLSQPITVVDKPGASGVIGMSDVINSKPDGYKLCTIITEIAILPSLGLTKYTHNDFIPIAQLNADPAAITVRADAPWNTIEEFLKDAKKSPESIKVGNSGNGSIYQLAHVALADKVGVQFNGIPFQGSAPAIVALLSGYIDAVSVSPGEVSAHVASGKLKTLAVMSDQRVKGFEHVPTFKEHKIDLSIGAWRGLGAPSKTPSYIINKLREVAKNTANDPAFKESLDKVNLGFTYRDSNDFGQFMERDTVFFKNIISKINFKA